MRCAICKRRTDTDESFGSEKFAICPLCFYSLKDTVEAEMGKEKSTKATLDIVFKIGRLKEKIT